MAIALGIPAALFLRDDLVDYVGLGLAPLSLWVGTLLWLSLKSPRRVIKAWRLLAASLVAAVATVGVLGAFDWPEDTVFEEISLGGSVGTSLVRSPFEWDFDGPSLSQSILAGSRVAALVAVAAAIVWTRRAAWLARRVGSFTQTVSVLAIALGAAMAERYQAFMERRRERKRAALDEAAAAPTATEAALLSEPSFRLEPSEPGDEGEAGAPEGAVERSEDRLEPGEERLWTEEEHEAVETVIAAAQKAAGVSPVAAAGEGVAGLLTPVFEWQLPSMELLKKGRFGGVTKAEVERTSKLIVESLSQHGIDASVDQVRTGPTVTMYGISPGWGGGKKADADSANGQSAARSGKRVRVDTILAREKDLALALASPSLRFESPIPGASLVGIEVPNQTPNTVTLRSVMESASFKEFAAEAALPVALGIASAGEVVFTDLAKMPHLLVAGATGSGKSVCINSVITGLLMVRKPEEIRLLLIDPKRVELTPYADVPHLSCPPVVETDKAVAYLRAAVGEMMQRFQILERAGAKNIAAYNETAAVKMPYMVIAVDELADLMLSSGNQVERLLVRLAQLGRATGIHLVVATQRPSVDVVTGLIKANFPSRISFAVTSQVDSRTIIDSPGADRLLGKGDMLFLPIDRARPMRVQGAFLTDDEVESVVDFWQNAGGPPLPQLVIPDEASEDGAGGDVGGASGDALFQKAVELAQSQQRLSTSLLQRRLRIGYPRAARLMDELEEAGVVGPGEPGRPRTVIGKG